MFNANSNNNRSNSEEHQNLNPSTNHKSKKSSKLSDNLISSVAMKPLKEAAKGKLSLKLDDTDINKDMIQAFINFLETYETSQKLLVTDEKLVNSNFALCKHEITELLKRKKEFHPEILNDIVSMLTDHLAQGIDPFDEQDKLPTIPQEYQNMIDMAVNHYSAKNR